MLELYGETGLKTTSIAIFDAHVTLTEFQTRHASRKAV